MKTQAQVGTVLISAALAMGALVVACTGSGVGSGKGEVRMETWDLRDGRQLRRVNWGKPGWRVNELFNHQSVEGGPIDLRIKLPQEREIEGQFVMALVGREDGAVDDVSLSLRPCSAEEAYERVKSFLDGLKAQPEAYERLERWYSAGPVSEPGEQLIINFTDSADPPYLGVDADWVWASTSDRNWVVSVGFFWD